MSTQEHLEAIVAHCKKNLELAEKRTPGKRSAEKDHHDGTWEVASITDKRTSVSGVRFPGSQDAAFIAACSQSAEAGWQATIAAIKSLQSSHDFFRISGLPGQRQRIENDMQQIIESYPIESL